eukprot:Skav209851  [mRNA]  locus=scaffold1684:51925:52719:+ [translate_table: standard]
MGSSLTKKKKKKDKKAKRSEKKKKKRSGKDDGESSHSGSSSSSSGSSSSVFRIAALPQGVEKLHRLHQERPGALANATLQRFQELLERSVGKGSAEVKSELPPVARAYLSQIFLPKHTEAAIGMRNLRELRTLTTLADLIAQNDGLRALDITLQRIKAIELFISQGNWSQASLIELILPEDEQRAWFRQELKAVQQEFKSEQRLAQNPWPKRRTPWTQNVPGAGSGGTDKRNPEDKEEMPPNNNPGGAQLNRKSKGKGKKGKRW